MPEKWFLKTVLIISCLLAALQIIGGLFPGSLNWGFHFLGFLPWHYMAIFVMLLGLIVLLLPKLNIEKFVEYLSVYMERRPYRFLVSVLVVFVVTAFVFRVKASLLGDSFTIIKSYIDYEQGLSSLEPWNEPFSMFFFYYAIRVFSQLTFPALFWSFFSVELLLGLAFIIIMFFTIREMFKEPAQQVMALCFILVLPYMELFFGYIEIYALPFVLLALFLLLSLKVLHDKLPFSVVPLCYVILLFSHFLNGALVISVLYLAYREYKKGKITSLVIGFSSAALLVLGIFTAVNFDITRLIDISPISHQLSFTENISEINKYSQAYTRLSLYHFTDLLNYFLMMSPLAIVVFVLVIVRVKKKLFTGSPRTIWFAIAITPILIALYYAKLEQGFADDWDVFAAYFMLVNVFAAYLFFQFKPQNSIKIFSVMIAVSVLLSLPWFTINAKTEPSIKRFHTLWDKRNVSQLGQYTMALRLSRYYDAIGNSTNIAEVWHRYRDNFPSDPRSYPNEITSIQMYTPDDYERKIAVYEQWLLLDPTNRNIRRSYAIECSNAGTRYYSKNRFDSALVFFTKAIRADSTQPRAYNNMGSIQAMKGNLHLAIDLFSKAIQFDSTYSDAYYNRGLAYQDSSTKLHNLEHRQQSTAGENPDTRKSIRGSE